MVEIIETPSISNPGLLKNPLNIKSILSEVY
jgi:hypothetical protein